MSEHAPLPFDLDTLVVDDVAVVRIAGDLDAAASTRLLDAVDKVMGWQPRRIDIDASAVPFIDSAGLRVLLQCHARARRESVELRIVEPSPEVIRLLTMTGLDDVLLFGIG